MKETPTQTLVNTVLSLSRELTEMTREIDESRRQTRAEQNACASLQIQIAAQDQLIGELKSGIATLEDNVASWQKKIAEKDGVIANFKAGLPALAKLYETAQALEHECSSVKARTAKIDAKRSDLRKALSAAFDYCDQIPF